MNTDKTCGNCRSWDDKVGQDYAEGQVNSFCNERNSTYCGAKVNHDHICALWKPERREMTNNTKLLQLEMPQKAYDRLKLLKEKTEAPSYSEVIKNALKLYEAMIEETENGGFIYTKSSDGVETRIKPVFC